MKKDATSNPSEKITDMKISDLEKDRNNLKEKSNPNQQNSDLPNGEEKGGDTKKSKKKRAKKKKAKIPVKNINEDFPDLIFPKGEYILNKEVLHGSYDETKDESYFDRLNKLRKAAEVHRRTRMAMAPKMVPNTNLSDFCTELENTARTIVNEDKIAAGLAFPTGVSVNECAAHYTPDIGETAIVKDGDMIKIDFGVHVEGNLVDCAFTVNLNPIFEPLKQSTIDATNTALKMTGPDALISDISAEIEDVINSYEVIEKNGNVLKVKPIKNLSGHQIEPYIIHAGKNIGLVRGGGQKGARMLSGEQYAIETFASTGQGWVNEKGENTHFMTIPNVSHHHPQKKARELLGIIRKYHHTLAFCQRFLIRNCPPDMKSTTLNYLLKFLTSGDRAPIRSYPPLCDEPGSMTSQMEHTLFIRNDISEIITRGPDY